MPSKPISRSATGNVSKYEVLEVADISFDDGGKSISLTIRTVNGPSLPLKFQHAAFARLVENLIGVGAAASRQRTGSTSIPFGEAKPTINVANPLTGMALAESDDRGQMFLLVRLFDMDLSFQVAKATLKQLAASFVQMTQALDADESNPH